MTILGATTNSSGPLRSRVDPLTVPLDPDEQAGWKPYYQYRGATKNADRFSCHVSVLVQGHCPHPPHTHPEEEILMMLAGEADLILPQMAPATGLQELRLRPGQFVYYPSHFPHSLRGASAQPANYLMFKWLGASGRRDAQLPFAHFDVRHFYSSGENSPDFCYRKLFDGPTACLARLNAHVTTLAPGAGYEPHVDLYDAAVVVLEGEVEALGRLGRRVQPHGLILFAAGEPHGMRNPGAQHARYVVFEFDSGREPPLFRRVTDPERWKRKLKAAFRLS